LKTLVAVEGHRWAIEDRLLKNREKTSFGPRSQTRADPGMAGTVMCPLVMLAFAMMAAIRHRANSATAPKKKRKRRPPGKSQSITTPPLIRWSIQENPPHCYQDLLESAFNPHTSSHGLSGAELTRLPAQRGPLQIKKATVMLEQDDFSFESSSRL